MSANSEKPCAYFPGLVDVCEGEDGQLVFLCVKDGVVSVKETITIDGVLCCPPPREKLPFTLPRLSEVLRHYEQDDPNLYHDVICYLKRFSALDDLQWAVVAHFVFLTYLHDHQDIDYCPYLLFYAVPERGKSRTGKSVVYITFRGLHVVELREAVLFRYSDNIHGTLFLDIMDVSKKAEQSGCNDLLLYRAEKGSKSVRIQYPDKGPFHDTTYYDNYGPTIIASNEQIHKILNTRCLPIDMPNIPGDYDNPRPEYGLELKERLVALRAKHLFSPLPFVASVNGISGRLWDITKPMLQVNALVHPDGREQLLKAILDISEKRTESNQDTTEGRLVQAIKELADEGGFDKYAKWNIKTYDIRSKYYEHRPDDKHFPVSWFAKKLISMSIRHRTVNGRSEMLFTSEEYERLLEQYGFAGRGTTQENPPPTFPLPLKDDSYQQLMPQVGDGRGKQGVSGKTSTFNNVEERNIYFEQLRVKLKEGMERIDAEKAAWDSVLQWRNEHDLPF
jgi:hypothetical protein